MYRSRYKLLRFISVVAMNLNLHFVVAALRRGVTSARSLLTDSDRRYSSFLGQCGIPSKRIEEIFPGICDLRISIEPRLETRIADPIDELAYLAMITRWVYPQIVFEIGTFRGRTALNFALNMPPSGKVYTLDLPPEVSLDDRNGIPNADRGIAREVKGHVGELFRGHELESKIHQLYGDSMTFDFSPYFGTVDLVFIDGAHSYAYAKSDTENAMRMLKPDGGVIIWHDFWNPGEYYGVTQCVLEFAQRHGNCFHIANTQLAVYVKR